MMSNELTSVMDIPVLPLKLPLTGSGGPTSSGGFGRRSFLNRVGLGTAAVVAASALGVLAGGKRAAAEPYPFETSPTYNPYNTPSTPCGTTPYCTPLPGGFISAGFCTTCDEMPDVIYDAYLYGQAATWYGWHYVGQRGAASFADRSDICDPGGIWPFQYAYDAWLIPGGACGYCPSTKYRCHDGHKYANNTTYETICSAMTSCGSEPLNYETAC